MTKYELLGALESNVIGQDHVLRAIAPYVVMHSANLSPQDRPLGVFLLLGPTGTGKTHTVRSLAKVLHGSDRMMIRIDCAELSLEHEVARMLGSPPGYLGHRETQPLITQSRLGSVTSNQCGASIVLFDEIEKAAPSIHRALLGILDHGTLTLGDNNRVCFETSMIFMTSNLGASGIKALMSPYGLPNYASAAQIDQDIETVAVAAAKRFFTPEFINRIDCVATYHPLWSESAGRILNLKLTSVERLIRDRSGKGIFG